MTVEAFWCGTLADVGFGAVVQQGEMDELDNDAAEIRPATYMCRRNKVWWR